MLLFRSRRNTATAALSQPGPTGLHQPGTGLHQQGQAHHQPAQGHHQSGQNIHQPASTFHPPNVAGKSIKTAMIFDDLLYLIFWKHGCTWTW